MQRPNRHEGQCSCGDVHITATGEPLAMGYCHCESCRARRCPSKVSNQVPGLAWLVTGRRLIELFAFWPAERGNQHYLPRNPVGYTCPQQPAATAQRLKRVNPRLSCGGGDAGFRAGAVSAGLLRGEPPR